MVSVLRSNAQCNYGLLLTIEAFFASSRLCRKRPAGPLFGAWRFLTAAQPRIDAATGFDVA